MADRLAGKVAIVTGAGSRAAGIGNGRAAAILFAREGARVLVVDRSRAAAEATLKMILGEGGEAAVFDADVTRSDDCAAMVDDAVRRWGRLDILDNNVGIGGRGTVVEVSEEDWERVMRVNVTGMMLASKHAIPVLARDGVGRWLCGDVPCAGRGAVQHRCGAAGGRRRHHCEPIEVGGCPARSRKPAGFNPWREPGPGFGPRREFVRRILERAPWGAQMRPAFDSVTGLPRAKGKKVPIHGAMVTDLVARLQRIVETGDDGTV